jgi:hypothetical protein
MSSSIGTPAKQDKPITGAHDTEVSSVIQKPAKTEESKTLTKSMVKAFPSPPLIARSTNVSRRISINKHDMDMPWVHDKFEMQSSPAVARQENLQLQSSYNASGLPEGRNYYPIRGPMTDSYRPPRDSDTSMSKQSSCAGSENSKKPLVYISLENKMQQKAWKNGLSKVKYENIRGRFRMEIKLRHAQRGYSSDWCLWQEEILTWIALCKSFLGSCCLFTSANKNRLVVSPEEFPGLEPLQYPHATNTSVAVAGDLNISPTTLKGLLNAAALQILPDRHSSLANPSLKKPISMAPVASHTKHTNLQQATYTRPSMYFL